MRFLLDAPSPIARVSWRLMTAALWRNFAFTRFSMRALAQADAFFWRLLYIFTMVRICLVWPDCSQAHFCLELGHSGYSARSLRSAPGADRMALTAPWEETS